MQPPFRNGFTLIEIVSVLVVLGVLAYLGISAFRGNDEITAYAERDRLPPQLVYARAQGMAMGGGNAHHRYKQVSFFMKGKSALPTLLGGLRLPHQSRAPLRHVLLLTRREASAARTASEIRTTRASSTAPRQPPIKHSASAAGSRSLSSRKRVRPMNARLHPHRIIVTIILMAIMGFMAATHCHDLRGSAESAGQIKIRRRPPALWKNASPTSNGSHAAEGASDHHG